MSLPFSFEMDAPANPWSTNDERRMHHLVRAGYVSAWRDATKLIYRSACRKAKRDIPLEPGIVRITIPFGTKRRRDPHNYCGTVLKAVIDGLVEAGAWPDDSPEWVDHLQPVLVKGKKVRVEILPR